MYKRHSSNGLKEKIKDKVNKNIKKKVTSDILPNLTITFWKCIIWVGGSHGKIEETNCK